MSIALAPSPLKLAPEVPQAAESASLTTVRVSDAATRRAALAVVREVYLEEKGWIAEADAEAELPRTIFDTSTVSWYLALEDGEPAGVVRLTYDPSLELPAEAGLELEPGIDIAELARTCRFAEVGRLMIPKRFRSRSAVVFALMRATLAEVVRRGYTHLLTVVFEDDPHSPYGFHTRVLGFERIGSHRRGELACASRRIVLTLDIARAFERLRGPRARLVKTLAGGLEEAFAGLATGR
jgi:hypothetical protein